MLSPDVSVYHTREPRLRIQTLWFLICAHMRDGRHVLLNV